MLGGILGPLISLLLDNLCFFTLVLPMLTTQMGAIFGPRQDQSKEPCFLSHALFFLLRNLELSVQIPRDLLR